MKINCPACGSRFVRHSKLQSLGERIATIFGHYQLRCKECQHRFPSKVWHIADLRWSRCPRCYRTDLSTWTEEHYLPRWKIQLMLTIGAKRLRCEYCRLNFAGFRPVKERYKSLRNRRKEEAEVSEQVSSE